MTRETTEPVGQANVDADAPGLVPQPDCGFIAQPHRTPSKRSPVSLLKTGAKVIRDWLGLNPWASKGSKNSAAKVISDRSYDLFMEFPVQTETIVRTRWKEILGLAGNSAFRSRPYPLLTDVHGEVRRSHRHRRAPVSGLTGDIPLGTFVISAISPRKRLSMKIFWGNLAVKPTITPRIIRINGSICSEPSLAACFEKQACQ